MPLARALNYKQAKQETTTLKVVVSCFSTN